MPNELCGRLQNYRRHGLANFDGENGRKAFPGAAGPHLIYFPFLTNFKGDADKCLGKTNQIKHYYLIVMDLKSIVGAKTMMSSA